MSTSQSGPSTVAARSTRSARRATPNEVFGARSTAMCFAAAAIRSPALSSSPVVPMRIGSPAEVARSRLDCNAAGLEKSMSTSPCSWSMTMVPSSAAAAAIAWPIRPFGANNEMRMGLSAAMVRRVMAKGGAPRNCGTALRLCLVRLDQLLQQHVAGDVAIGCTLSAGSDVLAIVALHERVYFLAARYLFGGRGHAVADGDEVKVGLVLPRVVVAQNVIGFDPAFRLRELVLFPRLADEEVGIVGEVTVIDLDRRDVPIVPADQRQALCGCRSGPKHHRGADGAEYKSTHA